ncbi:ABC transporter substrate-binding protein [Butyrivibrio sp. M55]|uniref:ABC transporter substrate-binding protein n=1 Tax=Butyrivibrio sp. M55 TaxID=1855323 RepID=UPI0008DF3B7E|nr:extracellular solute-binding protein [Butyrivibrio sp. M55]SFU37208.1 ABC-type glycerol-3-phosphate transport system, substrate-binding protein [Butyrivibrio sp. M55]
MGKRQFVGRAVSCLLVSVLLATSMTGCGKKKNNGVSLEDAKKIDKNCIFKQEDLEGILEPGEEVSVLTSAGDKIKVVANTENGKCRLISFNPDGSDVQSVDVGSGKDTYVYNCVFDKDGNAYMRVYVGDRDMMYGGGVESGDSEDASAEEVSFADSSASDASVADTATADASAAETSADEANASEDSKSEGDAPEEGKSYFVKLDPTGKELAKVDLDQFSKEGAGEDEGFDLYNMMWTEKYGLIGLSEEAIETFDEKNGPQVLIEKKKICGDDGWLGNISKLSENELLITYYGGSGEDGEINAILDLDKKEVGKKLEGFGKYGNYSFFTGGEGNLYASNEDGIFKYDMNAGKLNKLLDLRDSNIGNGGYMWFDAVALSDTEFIANLPGSDDVRNSGSTLARLTKVNPEDVVDKTVITLMSQYMNGDIGNAIMKFNRSNDKYMIKMINYDTLYQDDWEAAQKQFNLDITSGKAADIICVSNNEAALRKYVDKGILLDLTPAFEKGGPLGDIEYIPNVAEMMKIDGKFYTFMPSFYVETCSAKTKFLNGKTTLSFKDWDDIINANGAKYDLAFGTYNSRESVGSYLWTYYGDKFVDWKNKKCNFNSPEFIDYLNFVNKFPDEEHQHESEENGEWVPEEKYVQEDKTLFYRTFLTSFEEYGRTKNLTFKEDFEFVGFPNNDGENLAAIYPSTFAVNSKTEHKDVIYDLIKSILTAEKDSFYGFSPVKAKFEEQFAEATKEKSEDDYNSTWWDQVTGKEVKAKPLTQEEAQLVKDYILGIKSLECYDEEVSKIVEEETATFYSGQKTAEQVAEVIQNRVTTYLNENS